LAIGTGDMNGRGHFVLRVAELVEQAQDAIESEIDLLGMKREQAFEDGGASKIGRVVLDAHSAALAVMASVGTTRVAVALTTAGAVVDFIRGRERRIMRCSTRDSVGRSSWRCTTMSIMPCSSKYSARWKPSGSRSRMVLAMTRGPAKPICA